MRLLCMGLLGRCRSDGGLFLFCAHARLASLRLPIASRRVGCFSSLGNAPERSPGAVRRPTSISREHFEFEGCAVSLPRHAISHYRQKPCLNRRHGLGCRKCIRAQNGAAATLLGVAHRLIPDKSHAGFTRKPAQALRFMVVVAGLPQLGMARKRNFREINRPRLYGGLK